MALSVVRLKREYEIRLWLKIIDENPYIAVIQATGGQSWGRTNMKSRILGKYHNQQPQKVHARYAVPKAAREGALRSKRYKKLSSLFKTASSAVVYGQEVGPVAETAKLATELIRGGILIGGRFGDDIVTASVWKTVLESDGELQEWRKFVHLLDRPPPVISLLQQSNRGLLDAVENGGNAKELAHVLQRISDDGTSNSPG